MLALARIRSWKNGGRGRCFSSQVAQRYKDFVEKDELQRPINLSYPSYMIWGCNTGVGKTVVSTGLTVAALSSRAKGESEVRNVLYLKPVQTGYPEDSDSRFVAQRVDRVLGTKERLVVSNRIMHVSEEVNRRKLSLCGENVGGRDSTSIPDYAFSVEQHVHSQQLWKSSIECDKNSQALPSALTCKTLWSWYSAVSPHLAVEKEGGLVDDETLVETLKSYLWGFNRNCTEGDGISNMGKSYAFIETAGGIASPAPSGTLQCDLYRSLRLPGVLVGDGRLGGISTTLAAYESLVLRGYETVCVVVQDFGSRNHEQLSKHLGDQVPVIVVPSVPENMNDDLVNWFHITSKIFAGAITMLEDAHQRRLQRLNEMPRKASQLFWWPFTQHSLVPEEKVMVIDSRAGELFSVYQGDESLLVPKFDACASWWTQGPDATMQHELARQIAYAAGRYGHVMFPENVHEPGLRCAELLLQGVGKGWAHRVYFSDNGSTAIEIALKMAFRKFAADHGFMSSAEAKTSPRFRVLALQGSYHGDTLGAMEAQAPSPFTGFLQQPWYSGRGLFLEAPVVFCRSGRWHLELPHKHAVSYSDISWNTREEVFSASRDTTELAETYSSIIDSRISAAGDVEIAGLIIEPVIHAAGGMELVDPLFQRCLVKRCKELKIPVIFDEVFTGFWRLGAESAAELLQCKPDIACYAKLLTGGAVPLAATLASQDIFEVFNGPSKLDALLHGHSYTAHPIGCSAAVTAIQWFKDPARNSNLVVAGSTRLQEQWDQEMVAEISSLPPVARVISLGNVFACELQAGADKGYNSMLSKELVHSLRKEGVYVRPLGNVVYFMCGPLTKPSTCSLLLEKFNPLWT